MNRKQIGFLSIPIFVVCLFYLFQFEAVCANTFSVSSTNDSGAGSLRNAIVQANTNPGPDLITFAIPGLSVQIITLASPLPVITESVVIDGYSQPGSGNNTLPNADNATRLIEIVGSQVGTNSPLLTIDTAGTEVRGLILVATTNNMSDILITGSSNLIDGNLLNSTIGGQGILVSNASGNIIGGSLPARRNLFEGSGAVSILGCSAAGNSVLGNFMGVDASGTNASVLAVGVTITEGSANQIGGSGAGEGNVINASGIGVRILGDTSCVATSNQIQGNVISGDGEGIQLSGGGYATGYQQVVGTEVGGRTVEEGNVIESQATGIEMIGGGVVQNRIQGNAFYFNIDGIDVYYGVSNVIGGVEAGAGNVFSFSGDTAIYLRDSNDTMIQGNLIGTDSTGTLREGADGVGISVQGGTNTLIGGAQSGAGNVISGAYGAGGCVQGCGVGIYIYSSFSNQVLGNLIGTDVTGTKAIPNDDFGIEVILGDGNNTIGGAVAEDRNVISGNGVGGIWFVSQGKNLVQGNYIGTDITGSNSLPNGAVGIEAGDNGDDVIGGLGPGEANLIAFNADAGIRSDYGNNLMRGNSIFGNGNGGIWMLKQNPINAPVLAAAVFDGMKTTVSGSVTGMPSSEFGVDFYVNSSCDPSGTGEGKTYLDSLNVITDTNGIAQFNMVLPPILPTNVITATANTTNDTSAFSVCVEVRSASVHDIAVTKLSVPKRVLLTRKRPVRTGLMKLQIQNRSPQNEMIADEGVMTNLVAVSIQFSGPCELPELQMMSPRTFPITLKPKAVLNVAYLASYSCVDELPTNASPISVTLNYTAIANHAAIDGIPNTYTDDATCPHSEPLGCVLDPNPDGSIRDCGCGTKQRGGTFGGAIVTELVIKR